MHQIARRRSLVIFTTDDQVSQGIPQWESIFSLLIAEKSPFTSDF